MNVWSAELSKLAANAFLAQRISSINAITAIAEKTEADVTEVAAAIGLDRRIGARFLNAGIGFGGSCFRKDILNLVYLCEHYGLSEPAEYWAAVLRINDYQQSRFVSTMLTAMFNTVAGKRIALLGAAYKPGTDDTRDSPALAVCRALLAEAADVAVSDPRALENARAALGGGGESRFRARSVRGGGRGVRGGDLDRVALFRGVGLREDLPGHGQARVLVRRPEYPRPSKDVRAGIQRLSVGQTGAGTSRGGRKQELGVRS